MIYYTTKMPIYILFCRFREMQMYSIIRELIMYFLWLYMLMMVAYGNRDPYSYKMNANYKDMFIRGAYAMDDAKMDQFHFRKVNLCLKNCSLILFL